MYQAVEKLDALIQRLEEIKPLAEELARSLWRENIERMIKTGASHLKLHNHFSGNGDADHTTLSSSHNNLAFHAAWLDQDLDQWFEIGHAPAPYPAWRISVILQRLKDRDRELRFLAAWAHHFPSGKGARYDRLIERLTNLNAQPAQVTV